MTNARRYLDSSLVETIALSEPLLHAIGKRPNGCCKLVGKCCGKAGQLLPDVGMVRDAVLAATAAQQAELKKLLACDELIVYDAEGVRHSL